MDRNFVPFDVVRPAIESLSARRAWIEIGAPTTQDCTHASLSARRAWIEINVRNQPSKPKASLSARRAWIEIKYVVKDSDFSGVALRKESVDRNYYADKDADWVRVSLSARRAWIEISVRMYHTT